jgi:hypothetical protein
VAAGFLSKEWLDGLDLAGPGPGRPVQVRRVISDGPDGGEAVLEAAVSGPALAATGGQAPAVLTLTTTHDVAAAMDSGELAPAVAYMQGRLKAEGDMPTLYALLASAH